MFTDPQGKPSSPNSDGVVIAQVGVSMSMQQFQLALLRLRESHVFGDE